MKRAIIGALMLLVVAVLTYFNGPGIADGFMQLWNSDPMKSVWLSHWTPVAVISSICIVALITEGD